LGDEIRILNWNVAGAKYLQTKDPNQREIYRRDANQQLSNYICNHVGKYFPHVITLQENVQHQEPNKALVDFIDKDMFPGYTYLPFPLIDNRRHSYTSKWKAIENLWPKNTFFTQGNAFLYRSDLPIVPVWSLISSTRGDVFNHPHLVEKVSIESGIYFGDRNTEPRSALVAHFVFNKPDEIDEKTNLPIPQDVFVVNVHLTTLTNEREGIPEIDEEAVKIRLRQLEVIFSGIVSRYNRWAKSGFLTRGQTPTMLPNETVKRHKPLWIVCGDFNFTPEGEEYQYVKRRNFVDVLYGKGFTKASGYDTAASLTLDYIFAGPKFISYDEVQIGNAFNGEVVPFITNSDHRVLYAWIPLAYK
jgi:hypothetical protein